MAELEIAQAARNLGPVVHIRGSWVWEQEIVPTLPFRTYRSADADRSDITGWLARRWVSAGFTDLNEVIHAHSEAEAEAEFHRRARLANAPERPTGAALRRATAVPGATRVPTALDRRVLRRVQNWDTTWTSLFAVGLLATVFLSRDWWVGSAFGWAAVVAGWGISASLYWVLLPRVFGRGPQPSGTRTWSTAALITSVPLLFGVILSLLAPAAMVAWQIFLATLGLVFTVNGLRLLTAAAWTRQAAIAAVPVLLALFPPLTHQITQLSYACYLHAFHLSAGDAQVTIGWLGALVPVGAGTVGAIIALALAGYARHWHVEDSRLVLFLATCLFALGVLGATAHAWQAGAKAEAAAATGHVPTAWQRLEPEAVCVYPVIDEIPYSGQPPVLGHPVVTFGATATEVALWDPRSGHVSRIPGSSAALRQVSGLASTCPDAGR